MTKSAWSLTTWLYCVFTLLGLYLPTSVLANYPSQSYSAAAAPGVSSKSFGFDFLSGTINYSQNDIIGPLPYTRMYQGSVRSDVGFAMNFYDKLVTAAGWTDNYDNFIDFQELTATERIYRIRLPGEMQATFFVWNSSTDKWKRMYSSSPLEKMLSSTGILTKSDLGEYKITKSGEKLTIVKYGNTYVSTTYTLTSGTSSYLRILTATYPSSGKSLTFAYDAFMNMTGVQDNRGNSLTFTRAFKEDTTATTQTSNEKTVITAVTAGGATGAQKVSYSYKAVWNKNPNLDDDVVYTLTKSNSTVGGVKNFAYTKLMAPWANWFLRTKYNVDSFGTEAKAFLLVPILTEVKNATPITQSKLAIKQNYLATASGYSSASVTIRGYAPLGTTSTVNDMTASYNDLTGAVSLTNYKPDGTNVVTASTSMSVATSQQTVDGVTFTDDSQATLSYSSPTNFPIFTVGGQPVSSMTNDSYYSHLVSYKTLSGNQVNLKYDTLNRLTEKKETATINGKSVIRTTTFVYDKLSNGAVNPYAVPTKVTTPYLTVTNVVNALGQITKQTVMSSQANSTTKTIAYTYFATATQSNYGLIESVDGPRPDTIDKVNYTYDAYGNLARESQVVNGKTRLTKYLGYNIFGKPERIVYPSGLVDQFTYNADSTIKQKNHGVGGDTGTITGLITTYTYDTLKRLSTETNPDLEVTTYEYDVLNRVIKTTYPDKSVGNKTYFANNVVKSEELRDSDNTTNFKVSAQEIDSNGRVSKTRAGNNAEWYWVSYQYDNSGNLKSTNTPKGITESWTYDAFNRVSSHTDGAGNTDTKSYDLQDNVILSKDALSAGSDPLTYINGGILKSETNSDFGAKSYSYNEADILTGSTYGVRQCDYLNIDAIGRSGQVNCKHATSTTSSTSVSDHVYTYDVSRYGRLDTVTAGGTYGTDTTYGYDAYDRITSKAQTNKAINKWAGTATALTVGYNYSNNGKLTKLTLPSGRIIHYVYDTTKKGQLTDIKVGSTSVIKTVGYDDAGRMTGWTWGSGYGSYGWVYDITQNGAIKTITNKNRSDAKTFEVTYGFDNNGRITVVNRNNGLKDSFTYDNADRILTEKRVNGSTSVYGITYTYDANGNRTSLVATGSHLQPAAKANYTYLGNKLATFLKNSTSQTISHTNNAELQLSGIATIYDFSGMLRFETQSGTNNQRYMVYDHNNLRTIKSNKSNWLTTAIQYVYDESGHLLGEYNYAGAPLYEYVWLGEKPVAVFAGSGSSAKTYYIVTDSQNTPRRLVDPTNNDAVVWSWDSTAFGLGNPAGSVTFNLRFPGQYYDKDSKWFYNHNRNYNPELGRYMEPDPIGLEGGLNIYTYAAGNPISNTDATGLFYSPTYGMMPLSDFALSNSISDPLLNLANFSIDNTLRSFESSFNRSFSSGNVSSYSNYSARAFAQPGRMPGLYNPAQLPLEAGGGSSLGGLAGLIAILNGSDDGGTQTVESPIPDAVPHPTEPRTGSGTRQWVKPGDFGTAVDDFDNLNPTNVRPITGGKGAGGKVGILPDGRTINVRPNSDSGEPTIEIGGTPGVRKPDKVRYQP